MLQPKPKLAIVDWGIGGVSVYRLIKSGLGNIPVIYFSDTGATPYGRMTRRELVARLDAVLSFLRAEGVTHLVVGCNAASTVIPELDVTAMKVAGIIESGISATARMRPRKLALIGGRRTVLSGVYRRAFAKRGIAVVQRIAQPLSASIESGDVSSPKLREQCRSILAPLKTCSHVLLACTHYPAIISTLKDFVSADTVFIDPAPELVSRIKRWGLPTVPRAGSGRLPRAQADRFLTSGNPEKMKAAAFNAFGVKIGKIEATVF